MTGFIDWYGHGQVFHLENTYRCPLAICDVSSRFVTKNPFQLRKTVISVTEPIGPAFQVAGKDDIKDGFRQYLDDLYDGLSNDSIPSPEGRLVSVFILERLSHNQDALRAAIEELARWVGDRGASSVV
ncbi:hypothetical protein ACSQ5K_15100 [Pseudomonas sp. PhalM4]